MAILPALANFPFRAWTSPLVQWDRMPTFLLGETAIIVAALVALVHAVRRGPSFVVVWFAALLAGTANDLVFMALPLVDNFWHAQATWMLTPRLPLYIPCLYVLFMYYPVVAVSRLGTGRWATAALAGLLAVLTYAPFDIVGAKFLWWTWHDTDAPIRARLFGVPTSSTLWVLTFAGAFAWLVAPVLRAPATRRDATLALLRAAGLTTLGMLPQMTLLQQVDGGTPGVGALGTGLAVYGVVSIVGLRSTTRDRRLASEVDRLPLLGLGAHLAALALSIVAFDPATHVSTGVHETVGPCDVTATDITGATRRAFLCVDDFDEDYHFDCTTRPTEGARWYTVCGRAFPDPGGHRAAVTGLALTCALAYGWLFSRRRYGGSDASS